MHLDRGRVESERFDLDADDLLGLHLLEHTIQNAALGPAVHPRIDRMPAPEALRQTAPFTALFRDKQHCIQHLQVAQTHVAALHRQCILDPLILRFRDLHPQTLTQISRSVNSP
jgi:hypothetical protein